MKLTVQLVIEPGDGSTVVTEVATLEREVLTEETLGLSLAEGKAILAGVQEVMVAQQAASYSMAQQTCPACGAPRRCKGHHQIVVRSLFGTLRLDSPRLRRCCHSRRTKPQSIDMRSRWPSGLRVSSAMSSPFSLRAASVIGMRSRGRMARSRSASMAATSTPATATESKAGWFELIVGKSVPTDGAAKCFGFVTSYDTKPKRRLAELLKAQGLQMN